MTATPVVELRNEKAIVQSAQYVEGQLQACLELQMLDRRTDPLIERILAMVKSIGYGQDEKTLIKNFDNLVEFLSAPQVAGPVGHLVSLVDIETELLRRGKLRDEVARAQETLLNERDAKRNRLETVDQMLKHEVGDTEANKKEKTELDRALASLDKTIEVMTEAVSDNDRKVSRLVSYRAAVQLVQEGLPKGIIGENFNIR